MTAPTTPPPAPYRAPDLAAECASLRAEVAPATTRRLSRRERARARALIALTPHRGERVVLAPIRGGAERLTGIVARCWRWMRRMVLTPGGGWLIPGHPSRLEVRLDDGRTVTLDVRDPSRVYVVAERTPPTRETLAALRSLVPAEGARS